MSTEKMRKAIPPFLLGFAALSFQIILMREFAVHFYGNEITFGLILGTWLFWNALGSLVGFKIKFSPRRFLFLYHLLLILFIFCLIGLRLSRFVFHTLPGELTGIIPLFFSALLLSFFTGFPLGILFVFNIHHADRQLSFVYILESLGSAAAGLCVHFILVPFFSNWQMASLLGFSFAFTLFLSSRNFRSIPFLVMATIVMAAFWTADIPSQKLYWTPFSLIETRDTAHGTLHVLKTDEQISLYSNNVPIYTFPDLASAEELVHFPLLYKKDAKKVLILGGGSGEELRQILKYPHTEVECVELNPEILRLSFLYLPEQASRVFHNPRVHIFHEDGISYLKKTEQVYDIILINLPDPSSALINRFFTKEFFLLARNKLHPDGILSFSASSAENYISQELQDYLSSLYATLKSVFTAVEIIPGDSNVFLASSRLAPLNAKALSEDIRSLKLNNTFVRPERLQTRLSPIRISSLRETVMSGTKKLNLDLAPISYYFNSVLWSKQFKSFESKFFSKISRIPSFWFLDLPLGLLVVILAIFGLKRRQRSLFLLMPLMVMGLTTLIVEIMAIILFQTVHGFLYQKIALLLALFMTGLFVGALGARRTKIRYVQLIPIQLCLVLLLILSSLFIQTRPAEMIFFVYLFLLGLFNGSLFVVSNQIYLKEKKNFGLGYGLDLTGSFIGAVATSAFLIPLLGIPLLLKYVLFLNGFCLLFIVSGFLKGNR